MLLLYMIIISGDPFIDVNEFFGFFFVNKLMYKLAVKKSSSFQEESNLGLISYSSLGL